LNAFVTPAVEAETVGKLLDDGFSLPSFVFPELDCA
jgi:hypothetical protein